VSKDPYEQALGDYERAIEALYTSTPSSLAERGAGQLADGGNLPGRAQRVIDSSARLGGAAMAGLRSSAPEERELSALRLLAMAAADLAVANDLAWHREAAAREHFSGAERGGGLPSALADVLTALRAKSSIEAISSQSVQRAVRSSDLESVSSAQNALLKTVKEALLDIPGDAVKVVHVTFTGMGEITMPIIQEAAALVLHDLLVQVGEQISSLLRKAASLVLQAVDKILQLLGADERDQIRHQVADWIENMKSGTLAGDLLGRLYEIERIQTDVEGQIHGAVGRTPLAFKLAADDVQKTSDQFRKQRQAIEWVVRGLAWVRPWVITLQPWGPLALAGAYSGILGYAVCAGGVYVGWYRTDTFSPLVPGVRALVYQRLAP
jgi:hypothetical protein